MDLHIKSCVYKTIVPTETGSLTDVELRELSEEVSVHWQSVGVYLGLKACHIAAINSDYDMTEEKAFNMLIQWRQRLTTRTHARVLLGKALRRCKLEDLAEKVDARVWVVK